jgi:hypothetical protein
MACQHAVARAPVAGALDAAFWVLLGTKRTGNAPGTATSAAHCLYRSSSRHRAGGACSIFSTRGRQEVLARRVGDGGKEWEVERNNDG